MLRYIVLTMHLLHGCRCECVLPVSVLADNVLSDCRSNRTVCIEGDEAHCVVNGTDSFCSCKPGFQSNGPNRCEGTVLSALATLSTIYAGAKICF